MGSTCDLTKTPAPRARAAGRLLALLLLAASAELVGASHTWSGLSAVDGKWSRAENWSSGGAPVDNETAVELVFPAGVARMATSSNDLTGLDVTSMTFGHTDYAVSGTAIRMAGTISTISVTGGAPGTSSVAIGLDVVLTGTAAFFQSTNDSGNVYGLSFHGTISGAGGKDVHAVSLVGPSGEVVFAHANTYLGTTYVDGGTLHVDDAGGLGSPVAGTVVGLGATLSLNRAGSGAWILGEPLFVQGAGASGGAALLWRDLTWTGDVTLTGDTTLKAEGVVTVGGVVSGAHGLSLQVSTSPGTGELHLTESNTYSQPTRIEYGTVVVTGSQPASDFTLRGTSATDRSRLRGTGTVGAVSLEAVGSETKTIAPGTTAAPGTLHTKGLSLKDPPSLPAYAGNHGVLFVRLAGNTVGAFDQVAVTGSVDLTDATLEIAQWYTPAVGHSFTIVSNDGNDPVTGTFRVNGVNVPSLGTFGAGGRTFQIDYAGGDGNDVVLTCTSLLPVTLQTFDIE